MTLAQVIAMTRTYLNVKQETGAFTDANLTTIANIAQADVFNRLCATDPDRFRYYESKQITFASDGSKPVRGTGKAFTYDCRRIDTIAYRYSTTWPNLTGEKVLLPYVNPQEFQQTSGEYYSNSPQCWTQIGEKLFLYPKPSSAVTLEVVYVPSMPDMTSSGTPVNAFNDMWPEYHHLIPLAAAILVAASTNEPRESLYALNEQMWQNAAAMMQVQQQEPMRCGDSYGY